MRGKKTIADFPITEWLCKLKPRKLIHLFCQKIYKNSA